MEESLRNPEFRDRERDALTAEQRGGGDRLPYFLAEVPWFSGLDGGVAGGGLAPPCGRRL